MKSIKVDYTDPDNRVITVVDDDDEERVLEIDDGVNVVEIDGEALEITRTVTDEKSLKGTAATFMAVAGLLTCGAILGLGAYCAWKLLEWIF